MEAFECFQIKSHHTGRFDYFGSEIGVMLMEDKNALNGEYKVLSVHNIRPNPWNPNEMSDDELNLLADKISEQGMIDPIQVVPLTDDDGNEYYQIMGGEHRWMAVKYSGKNFIPAIVLTDEYYQDLDNRKFITVQLNALRGSLNPQKFVDLWEDLASRHNPEDMQRLMAFTDDDLYKSLTRDIVEQLNDSGLPDQIKDEFRKKVKDEKVTVDGMAEILNSLFRQYGDTMPYNFMFFEFGGKKHVKVITSKSLFKKVSGLLDAVAREKADASTMFELALKDWNEDTVKSIGSNSDAEE